MRILSVVTLVTPLGEYGGPLRVAVNQARALMALGHQVTLVGSARGYPGILPSSIADVESVLQPAVTLVPGIGFAGVGSPRLWHWLYRHVRDYDVVHVHAARDLVTLPAARIAAGRGVPYVLQTHGMIDPSQRLLAKPLDVALTRRVLRRARTTLYLTDIEKEALLSVAGALDLAHLPNGVPLQSHAAAPLHPTVLYLARLAPRKRPTVFVEASRRVASSHPDTRFVMVGPDEGEGADVLAAIGRARDEGVDISWDGALPPEATVRAMAGASLYVLPSVDEPYPMTVLEAMSIGLPVIVTQSCGLAEVVRAASAGSVVNESVASLSEAILRLLEDPDTAASEGASGRDFVRRHHNMESIARQLISIYTR